MINDGSTDGTQAVVEEYVQLAPGRFGILSLSTNSVKAVHCARVNAVSDIYLFLDADLGSTACYARILGARVDSEADMTIARFSEGQSLGRTDVSLGAPPCCLRCEAANWNQSAESLSGQRAVKAEVLQA